MSFDFVKAPVVLALARLCGGQTPAPLSNPTGTVAIHVFNGYGDEMPPTQVRRFEIVDSSGEQIPTGIFTGTLYVEDQCRRLFDLDG
jgi:hypothetical protein